MLLYLSRGACSLIGTVPKSVTIWYVEGKLCLHSLGGNAKQEVELMKELYSLEHMYIYINPEDSLGKNTYTGGEKTISVRNIRWSFNI